MSDAKLHETAPEEGLDYDSIITTSGVEVPFEPETITPALEKPMRNNRYKGGEVLALKEELRPGNSVLELGAGIGLLSDKISG